jgi:hypothetical protein
MKHRVLTVAFLALVALSPALACSRPRPPQEPPHVEVTASQPSPAQSAPQPNVGPVLPSSAATGAPDEPPAVRHDGRG